MSVDPWAALRNLRIGCVKYLNSRPLICAYDGPVIFDHPSALARMLAADELDAALVPVFGALRDPSYLLVDGAAIACDGPVYSVLLAYKGDLRSVKKIALDPASLTSANLLRVLLAEFHGLRPEFGTEGEARLIIGNQAIEFRLHQEAPEDWQVLDLGAEWRRCTGLPFVFALWALRPGTPLAAADGFRRLKDVGTRRIAELVKTETFATEEIRTRYLTEYLRFDIGENGRAAIERYRALLTKYGLIAPSNEPLQFV